MNDRLIRAVREWTTLLGSESVLLGTEATERYGKTTISGQIKHIYAALIPRTREDVVAIVKIANTNTVPIYPISRGCNWGYGSKSPPLSFSVVVDLSLLNRILHFNPLLGIVTLEPGVTARQLSGYLAENKSIFLYPPNGGGSLVSVVGNALERGHTVGAPSDRFSSLMSLEVVLSDGSLYQSPLHFSTEKICKHHSYHKWGVGPYLDGIFTQSNLGIILSASFQLTPIPAYAEVFYIGSDSQLPLSTLVDTSRTLRHEMPSVVSSIKIEGPWRSFAQVGSYGSILSYKANQYETICTRLNSMNLSEWNLFGVIQGNRSIVRAARNRVRELFPHRRIFFLNRDEASFFSSLRSLLPRRMKESNSFVPLARKFLSAVTEQAGKPSGYPRLPLWIHGKMVESDANIFSESGMDYLNYAGLIFFVAIVPMDGKITEDFLKDVHAICLRHHIEPLLALLSMSDSTFHLSLQITFNKEDGERIKEARKCYKELYILAERSGIFVYRVPLDFMNLRGGSPKPHWDLVRKVKYALDPHNIISPGRYDGTPRDM